MIQIHPINDITRKRYIAPTRIAETGSFLRKTTDGIATVNYVIVDGLDLLEIRETPDQMNMLLFAWENRGRLSAGSPAVSVYFNLEEEAPEFTVIQSC